MLVDVSGDEFESFMEILNKMQHLSTSEGSQQVIDIISEQAELEEEFQVYTEAYFKEHCFYSVFISRLRILNQWTGSQCASEWL